MIYQNTSPVSTHSEAEEDNENNSFSDSQDTNYIPLSVRLPSVITSSSTSSPRTPYFTYLSDDLRKRVEDYINVMTSRIRPTNVDEFVEMVGDIMRTLPPAKQLELKIQIIQLLLEYEEKILDKSRPEE